MKSILIFKHLKLPVQAASKEVRTPCLYPNKLSRETKYTQLPSSVIIFITQDDIFKKGRAMYTFTEQCEEIPGMELEDGTKKIFLNMSSKNGRPELISLLQYMKKLRSTIRRFL